jgi:ABC-2 type transport system ATP-binding protein
VTTTVSLSGVGRRYGATTALQDVHLALGPGITGLLGAPGPPAPH